MTVLTIPIWNSRNGHRNTVARKMLFPLNHTYLNKSNIFHIYFKYSLNKLFFLIIVRHSLYMKSDSFCKLLILVIICNFLQSGNGRTSSTVFTTTIYYRRTRTVAIKSSMSNFIVLLVIQITMKNRSRRHK